MHIAHHFTEIRRDGGGVPRAVLDLVRALASAGDEVTLLTAAGSDLPEGWRDGAVEGIEVVLLDRVSSPFQWLSRQGLRRAAETLERADVLHLHGLWRPRNAQIGALARRMATPYILSLHGMLNEWSAAHRGIRKAIYFRAVERRNLAAARTVHATAEPERDQARTWLAHERLTVIPLAVDLGPYAALPDAGAVRERHPEIAEDVPAILMLGRLHAVKRPELLIESVAMLRGAGTECQLLFAGDGEPAYVRRLHALAQRLGITRHTHFLGLVAGAHKRALYRRADLMALPTRGENFGLVLFEALACGTPVITTRGANTWSEISSSGGGRIVEPTPEAFGEAIAELLADPELRTAMGRAGRDWVFRWLDPRAVIGRYQEMYRSAATG